MWLELIINDETIPDSIVHLNEPFLTDSLLRILFTWKCHSIMFWVTRVCSPGSSILLLSPQFLPLITMLFCHHCRSRTIIVKQGYFYSSMLSSFKLNLARAACYSSGPWVGSTAPTDFLPDCQTQMIDGFPLSLTQLGENFMRGGKVVLLIIQYAYVG